MIKTGYHVVYAKDYFQGIADARTYGFDFAQFELGVPAYYLDGLSPAQLKDIRDCAGSNGIELTFHAPGDNVSLYADYPCVRRGNLEQFKRILEQANQLQARHITLHAGDTSAFKQSGGKGDDFLRAHAKHFEDILYENLLELLSNAGGVLICLENYKFNEITMRAAQRLIDEGRGLWLTLDVAKQHDMEFYRKNQKVIREMHIHDYHSAFGQHQTVGTGNIDFTLFKEFLSPDVYLNFEVRPVIEAARSKLAWEAL